MDVQTRMTSEPVRRTVEIEELSNLYVVHPISGWLTPRFARLGITPNAVSLTGMACGVAAGVAYNHYQSIGWACVGFVLMIAWHVFDGVDGQLARLTNAQSQLGKVLDGVCDYSTFFAVYVGLGLVLARQHGAWVWGLIALSAACHAVQSAAYEVQRQDYEFWGKGKTSANLLRPLGITSGTSAGPVGQVAHRLDRLYASLQLASAGIDRQRRQQLTRTMERPERSEALRRAYREMFAPRFRLWSVLSANVRTLGIFAFAAFNAPLSYFWFESVVLSLVLAALLYGQRPLYATFTARSEGMG